MPKLTQENWNEWYDKIFGYYYLRVTDRSIVESLTAEVVTDFFMYKSEVQNESALIYKIASNRFKKYLRQKSNTPKHEDIDNHDKQMDGYGSYADNSNLLELKDEISKYYEYLSDSDKEIIELCVMCDFSSQRAADELDISPSAVRKRLSRAISRLKKQLTKNNITLQYA